LVVWLSAFRALAGSVANWNYATLVRRFGEAARLGKWSAGLRPTLHQYPGICLTTVLKSRINLSQGKRRALGCSAASVIRLAGQPRPSPAMASTGLLSPAALGFRVRRRGQPSVSESICRNAVLGGCPQQLTLSQRSRSGLLWVRQTAERRLPRVSTCYVRTRGHQLRGNYNWIATPVASGNGCGQRTYTWGSHSPS